MIHGLSRSWGEKRRSLKEREREREVVINGGRRENRKSWFESRSRRCPLREIDAGETDGNQAAGLMNFFGTSFNWNLFFPPSSAFITNATVIANSGFDRSNYFSSSVRALIACFMAGVSHLSSNRSPDKRSDYRRFDSNEGLKYRLINSMLVKNWREFVPRAGVSPWNFSRIPGTVMKLVQNAIRSKKKNKIACAYWWKHSYANVFREEISDM